MRTDIDYKYASIMHVWIICSSQTIIIYCSPSNVMHVTHHYTEGDSVMLAVQLKDGMISLVNRYKSKAKQQQHTYVLVRQS